MQLRPSPGVARPRVVVLAAAIAAMTFPLAGALTGLDPAAATTPPDAVTTEPTTPTTPDPATTPAPPTTPAINILGTATAAHITWMPPATLVEEQPVSLTLAGEINGQATSHIALVPGPAACPASPLYPRQLASGTRLAVTADAPVATTPVDAQAPPAQAPLGGTVAQALSVTAKDSGIYHLCGWVVGFPSASEASTVAVYDQAVTVANRPASIALDMPGTTRAGDYFSVKATGNTAASGRRALIMAEPDKGQTCDSMRKAAAGKRPLQSVVGLPTGAFTKTFRLRYSSKTAGNYLFCVQIVESVDRTPEAWSSRQMVVTEGIKCVSTQTALSQRGRDLTVIRARRDAALKRLSTAKKRLSPAKTKVSKQRKVSNRRIASARKAMKRAKSAAGRKKASRRLARVKKTEAARIYRAGSSLRSANAAIRLHERSYRQYRTGASLLSETITRTKKDLKKYCANPSA